MTLCAIQFDALDVIWSRRCNKKMGSCFLVARSTAGKNSSLLVNLLAIVGVVASQGRINAPLRFKFLHLFLFCFRGFAVQQDV